jgi:hypothetical protein
MSHYYVVRFANGSWLGKGRPCATKGAAHRFATPEAAHQTMTIIHRNYAGDHLKTYEVVEVNKP